MKLKSSILVTAIFLSLFTANLYAFGTLANTPITNGDDRPTLNVADQPGDVIVTWHGGLTQSTATSNAVTIHVDPGYGIVWVSSPIPPTRNLPPGSTAYYGYAVRNIGNITDIFTLETSTISTNAANVAAWTRTIYKDESPYGVYNGETLVVSNTGDLPSEATYYLLLAVHIPIGTVNGSSTTVRLTVKNQNGAGTADAWPINYPDDNDIRNHDTLTSYAEALLQVVKSTAPVSGRERPGDIYEYVLEVKNIGVIAATNITLRDRIPLNLTFNPDGYAAGHGIRRIHPTPPTNYTSAVDGDGADYHATDRVVEITIGTLAPGASVTYKFQVRVD